MLKSEMILDKNFQEYDLHVFDKIGNEYLHYDKISIEQLRFLMPRLQIDPQVFVMVVLDSEGGINLLYKDGQLIYPRNIKWDIEECISTCKEIQR